MNKLIICRLFKKQYALDDVFIRIFVMSLFRFRSWRFLKRNDKYTEAEVKIEAAKPNVIAALAVGVSTSSTRFKRLNMMVVINQAQKQADKHLVFVGLLCLI